MQLKKLMKPFEPLWEHYKMPFLGFLITVLMVWMLDIPSLFVKPAPAWNVYEINGIFSSDEIEQKMDEFQSLQREQGESFEVYFDDSITFSLDGPDSSSFDQMARFTALIAAKEIDLLVSEQSIIEHYASLGGFVDLEAYLSTAMVNQWKENLVYIENKNGEKRALAIRLPLEHGNLAAIPLNSENKKNQHRRSEILAA